MIGIALSLGFLGSLHCIGMCGPVALLTCNSEHNSDTKNKSIILYQLGRVLTYVLLGMFFGLIGSIFYLTNIQKIISISGGILLIGFVFLSLNIDSVIQKSKLGKAISSLVGKLLLRYTKKIKSNSPLIIGLINGLLPCGLVYLALAGALISENIVQSSLFMLFFGLGTIPAMAGFLKGFHLLPFPIKQYFNKAIPIVTLCFGGVMIYRGLVIEMPMELSFFEAIKNPIMCH